MITVRFGYKLINGHEHGEFTADIDSFRRFCQDYLRGMTSSGRVPKYLPYDVSALYCLFSDGRRFIWQRHSIDKYGRKHGGWQAINTLPDEAIEPIVSVS